MDPMANVTEQLEIAERALNDADNLEAPDRPTDEIIADLTRLSELVMALDEWRRKGGFDPYTYQGE